MTIETQEPTGFNLEADPGYTPPVTEPVEKGKEVVYFGGEQAQEPVYFKDEKAVPSVYSETGANTLSLTFSLANEETKGTTDFAAVTSNAIAYEKAIQNGQEESLRASFAEMFKINQTEKVDSAIKHVVQKAGYNPSGNDIEDVKALVGARAALEKDTGRYSAEKMAVTNMISAALGFNTNAAHRAKEVVDTRNPKAAEVMDKMDSNLKKALMLRNELSKIQMEFESQGIGSTLLDFLAMLVPTNFTTAQSGNFSWDKEWSATPGRSIVTGMKNLMDLPLTEFEKKLPILIENIKKGSGYFSRNKLMELSVLSDAMSTEYSSAFGKDALVAMDLLSFPGLGWAVKGMRTPYGAMRVLGFDQVADRMAASAFIKDLEKTGVKKSLMTPEEALDAIMPKEYKTTSSLAGGSSGPINKVIDTFNEVKTRVREIINPSMLTKEEFEAAVAAKTAEETKKASKEGYIVFDFESTSGNRGPLVTFKVGTKDGRGYATEEEAILAAGDRGWAHLTPSYTEVYRRTAAVAEETIIQQSKKSKKVKAKVADDFFDEGVPGETVISGKESKKSKAKTGSEFEAGKVHYQLKEDSTVSAFRGDNGDWYLKVEAPIDAKQFMVALDAKSVAERVPYLNSIRSADTYLNDITQSQVALAEFTSQAMKEAIEPAFTFLNRLGSKSRRIVSEVALIGEEKGQWLSLKEFESSFKRAASNKSGRAPTEAETMAYYTHKELHDLDYGLRNSALRMEKQLSGMVGIEFSGKALGTVKGQGHVLTHASIREPSSYRFYNATTDEYYGVNKIDRVTLSNMLTKEGYKLISVDEIITHPASKDPIKYVLVKEADFKQGPLPLQQLAYRGGGHRLYKGKYFGKQAVTGSFSDGTKYVGEALTHMVSTSKREAEVWVAKMEDLRVSYNALKEGKTSVTPLDIDAKAKRAGFTGGIADLEQAIKDRMFILDHEFEVVFDTEMPRAHIKAINDPGYKDLSAGSLNKGLAGWYREQGRMFVSQKGPKLPGPDGLKAAVLDPWETSKIAITNSINNKAWFSYRVSQTERWAKAWEHLIDKTGFDPGDLSSLFWHGTFKQVQKGTNLEVEIATATRQRDTIMRLMGSDSHASVKVEHAIRSLAEWVDAKGWKNTGQFLLDVRSKDPITFMRSWAFDLKLGLFNPSQLLMQAQTMFATLSLNLVDGSKAFASMPAVRMALINGSEEVLGFVANRTALHGMDPKEFKLMVTQLRKSGIMNVGGEVGLLDSKSVNVLGSVESSIEKMREFGRVFFYEGERYNRITAYGLAWREFRKAFPKDDITSVFAKEWLAKKTNDYSMRMIRTSNADWQKGLTSLGTQFLAYQARMIENILPEFLGGYKGFTARQKSGLFLSQALLYGTAGIPFMDFVASYIPGYKEMSPETQRIITSGLIDGVIRAASSGQLDTDLANRAGLGAGVQNWLNDLAGKSDKSIIEIIGGPSLGMLGDFAGSTKKVLDFMWMAENPLPGIPKILLNDFSQYISTLKYIDKEREVARYHVWYSKQGDMIADVSTPEEFAVALGIPLKKVTNYYKGVQEVADNKKVISDKAKEVHKLILDSMRNPEKMDHNSKLMQALIGRENPSVIHAIHVKVNSLGKGINNAYGDMMMNRMKLGLPSDSLTIPSGTSISR